MQAVTRHRVVLQGVEPGRDSQLALHWLAVVSKKPADTLRPLLGPCNCVIRRGLDRESALRYQAVLRQAGWRCEVVAEAAAAAPGVAPARSPVPAEASPRPMPEAAPRLRGRRTAAVIAIGVVTLAAGAGLYLWRKSVDPGVDIAGRWNCLPADRSVQKETLNYVVAFGNDGNFSMTSAKSYEIQYAGTYSRNINRISVTLRGGALMRRTGETVTEIALAGTVASSAGDQLALQLAVPRVAGQNWSCSRL